VKDIYWIQHATDPHLAIVPRPRGGDWLEDDLSRLRSGGIDILVSLLTEAECQDLDLNTEPVIAQQVGMTFKTYPIPDRTTPEDSRGFRAFIRGLAQDIRAGMRVGIHCRGSIGRATMTAASVMRNLGWDGPSALSLIEAARGCPVPDTPEQRRWILTFQP
jgi:protein-tyrosine phosphatase